MTGPAWKPRYLATRMRADDGYIRERFVLPTSVARAKVRSLMNRYPKSTHGTTIERWRDAPDGGIEFVVKRLPSDRITP